MKKVSINQSINQSINIVRLINIDLETITILNDIDIKNVIFVYISLFDYLGIPWISEIIKKEGKFVGLSRRNLSNQKAASYRHIDLISNEVLNNEWSKQNAEGYAKWNEGDFNNITQAIAITSEIPGDYVEIGCYRGSSGSIALHYMKIMGLNRGCWFFDVFEGFNYDEAEFSSDAHWYGTHSTEGFAVVRDRLKTYETKGNLYVNVLKSNIITDELPDSIEDIVIANIDVDMYEPTLSALNKVFARLVPGGIIIAQDPGKTPRLIGARVALDEFLRQHKAHFIPIYMQSGQTLLIRIDK